MFTIASVLAYCSVERFHRMFWISRLSWVFWGCQVNVLGESDKVLMDGECRRSIDEGDNTFNIVRWPFLIRGPLKLHGPRMNAPANGLQIQIESFITAIEVMMLLLLMMIMLMMATSSRRTTMTTMITEYESRRKGNGFMIYLTRIIFHPH